MEEDAEEKNIANYAADEVVPSNPDDDVESITNMAAKQQEQFHDILEVTNKRSDESEHMLPVHFLPEGKKLYDWINQDLEKSPSTLKDNKAKSSTVSSITYRSSHLAENSDMDVNKQQTVQNLLSAAEHGDLEKVKEILRTHPLWVNCRDNDGYTPLHRACHSGHENVVLYLLEHGGSVHSRTDDGWQPLHCAARWNLTNICKILLDNKSDVNSTTKGKQTPLHLASLTSDSLAILEMFLLSPGVDTSIKNAAGDTARDIAFRSGPQYQLFELVDDGLCI